MIFVEKVKLGPNTYIINLLIPCSQSHIQNLHYVLGGAMKPQEGGFFGHRNKHEPHKEGRPNGAMA
jgi:hypothetical protein